MNTAEVLVEVHRGPILECKHRGHVAIWRHGEGLIAGLGATEDRILPRSSSKMIQALPLVESGAADAVSLTPEHLALACASHQGAAIHTDRVTGWLEHIGLGEADFRCGSQWPNDIPARDALICSHCGPDQRHNNCSGKHTGFLTYGKHVGAGPDYVDPAHPLQAAIMEAWDDVTEEPNPEYAIDGCSAPNFATRLSGLARAMAAFAAASPDGGSREAAMVRLREAMMAHPDLVAGEGRACTRLMRTMGHRAAVKTGAEGVFIAIVPELKIGVALKIADGATRGSEAAIAHILGRLGVLDPNHPEAQAFTHGPIRNWNGIETGHYRIADALSGLRI
ncbi:asparaginase [Jannaschia sp. CCS1]|uniref:asparaginase n=1 Tax=Jannaschia sp. (strain CCS1) TaxID=290400 RepID=UPI000053D7AB|nr:asparaginase [Jannaschia sp. CCS1]ABD53183.1 asparaginase [Jannaschia sp. CCS1]